MIIDKSLVQESLMKLADKVQNYDPDGAIRLRLLGDVVMGGPNIDTDIWITIDVYKFVDPDSIVQHFRSQFTRAKYIDILELIRNTLVLFPIIVTWYAISRAVPAYHDLLAGNPNQVQFPFLYFWQQGFGPGFPQILTLGSVALIDAIILIGIFALTFLTYLLVQLGTNKSELEAQSLRSELTHALAGASVCLQGIRQQPFTASDNLEVVARQIDAMTRQTASQFQKMTDQVLNQFTSMTNLTTKRLGEMADQAYVQFHKIAQQMSTQIQEGQRYLGTMTNFATNLEVLSSGIHAATQTIEATNSKLQTSVNELVGPARELSLQQKTLSDMAKESLSILQSTATALADLGSKQDRWSGELRDVLDNLNVAVEKGVQLATSVGSLNAQQVAFLETLKKEHIAQRDLATLMSDATVSVREALSSINTAGMSLRSMAHDMKDLLDLQHTSDASAFIQNYAIAAQMIEKSANSLNASAIAIYQASQKLTEVVYDLEDRLATIK